MASESIVKSGNKLDDMTLLVASSMSDLSSGVNSYNWHLLRIAGLILWYGLDEVIPTKIISPLSITGRRISCFRVRQFFRNSDEKWC